MEWLFIGLLSFTYIMFAVIAGIALYEYLKSVRESGSSDDEVTATRLLLVGPPLWPVFFVVSLAVGLWLLIGSIGPLIRTAVTGKVQDDA